jgi:hypothetical protein
MQHLKSMIMKMNIKKQLKTGNINIFLKLSLVLSVLYLVITMLYYLDSIIHPNVSILRAIDRPFVLYIVKWLYALIIIICLVKINSNFSLYYLIINTVSFAILSLSFMDNYYFLFYECDVEMFLLEIVAIVLIIVTNLKAFITNYNQQRKVIYFIYIISIPLVITYGIYTLLDYMIRNGIVK